MALAAAGIEEPSISRQQRPQTRPWGASEQRKEVSKLLRTYVWVKNGWYSLTGEKGQTMAEYGIVLAVITIGILTVLGFLSGQIQAALNAVANRLDGEEGPAVPAGG